MGPVDTFSNGELTFDVTDAGPADGPVVVLLHGFPQFKDSWDGVIEQLTAQGYRCLAPNQRGYSPGARPPRRRDYRVHLLVSDVLALDGESIKPAPEMSSAIDTAYITGLGTVGERMLILMDIEGLMASPEMGLINAEH